MERAAHDARNPATTMYVTQVPKSVMAAVLCNGDCLMNCSFPKVGLRPTVDAAGRGERDGVRARFQDRCFSAGTGTCASNCSAREVGGTSKSAWRIRCTPGSMKRSVRPRERKKAWACADVGAAGW